MPKSKAKVNMNGTVGTVSLPWRDEPKDDELIKCTGTDVFLDILQFYKDHMVYQKPIEYIIDAIWDMHTYFMHRFDSTPYLGYYGAGNEKGKSKALKIHARLSYRGSPITSGTDAAFRKCLTEGGTILVDQAENLFYDGKRKTFMYQVFTSGYTRDFKHIQLDQDGSKEFDCKEVFGAKAFCQQEDGRTENPIDQRTIEHKMIQGVPKIKSFRRNKESYEMINFIFYRMHWLREQDLIAFEKNTIDLNYDTGLDGRAAELIDPLLLTCQLMHLPAWVEKALYIYAFEMMDEKRDRSADTLPAIISFAIPEVMKDIGQYITSTYIGNWILQNYPDKYTGKNLYPSMIGKNLRLMGFKDKHIKLGNVYDMGSPESKEILTKVQKQYSEDTGISTLINISHFSLKHAKNRIALT